MKRFATTESIYMHIYRRPPAIFEQFLLRLQVLLVHFEPEILSHKVRSRQLLGSRLQHRTFLTMKAAMKSWFTNSLHALPWLNAPLHSFLELAPSLSLQSRHHSAGHTPSVANRLPASSSSSYAPLRLILSKKRIFSFFPAPGDTRLPGSPLAYPCLSLGLFISSNERTSNASLINREQAFDDTLLRWNTTEVTGRKETNQTTFSRAPQQSP
jgi:hypothetical protein